MSSQSEVMHCYELIASLTDCMLLRARAEQWSALPELEASCSGSVDRLKVIEAAEVLLEVQAARKYQLLSRITLNQAEISKLIMPELRHLAEALKSLELQSNLRKAYNHASDFYS